MELLLWRWSTAVQVTSMIMIAVFFAALSRSVRRPEMRLWACAWLADLAALVLALGFWYFQPDPRYHHPFFAFYLGAKVAFVLLLQGAWVLRGKGGWLLRNRIVVPAAALFSIITAFVVQNTHQLGLVTYPVLALVLLCGVLPLARPLSGGTAWLAAGLLTRAVLLLLVTRISSLRAASKSSASIALPRRRTAGVPICSSFGTSTNVTPIVSTLAYYTLGSRAAAEDAVQTVFLKAFANASPCRAEAASSRRSAALGTGRSPSRSTTTIRERCR